MSWTLFAIRIAAMGASERPRDDRHLSEDELNRYLTAGILNSTSEGEPTRTFALCRLPALAGRCPDSGLVAARLAAGRYPALVPTGSGIRPAGNPVGSAGSAALADAAGDEGHDGCAPADAGRHHRVPDCRRSPSSGPVSELAAPAATTSVVGGDQFAATNTPGHHRDSDCQYCPKGATSDQFGIANSGNNAAADESGAGADRASTVRTR